MSLTGYQIRYLSTNYDLSYVLLNKNKGSGTADGGIYMTKFSSFGSDLGQIFSNCDYTNQSFIATSYPNISSNSAFNKYITINRNSAWNSLYSGSNLSCITMSSTGRYIITGSSVTSQNGYINYSTNSGSSFAVSSIPIISITNITNVDDIISGNYYLAGSSTTWTSRTYSGINDLIFHTSNSANSAIVGIADNSYICYSTDRLTWTKPTIPNVIFPYSYNLACSFVYYNSSNGRWIVGCGNKYGLNNIVVISSSDGTTWTSTGSTGGSNYYEYVSVGGCGVASISGTTVVLYCNTYLTEYGILYSTNGSIWAKATTSILISGSYPRLSVYSNGTIFALAFISSNNTASATIYVYTSSDGNVWSGSPFTQFLGSGLWSMSNIVYANSYWMLVYGKGTNYSLIYSNNAINWSSGGSVSSSSSFVGDQIAVTNGTTTLIIIKPNTGTAAGYLYSNNSTSFSLITPGGGIDSYFIAITYIPSKGYFVGLDKNNHAAYTTDGTGWVAMTGRPSYPSLGNDAYGYIPNSRFVSSTTTTSICSFYLNSAKISSTGNYAIAIAYQPATSQNNGLLLSNNTYGTSFNTSATFPISNTYNDCCISSTGQYACIISNNNTLYYSTNSLASWASFGLPGGITFSSIGISGNGQYVALGGTNGTTNYIYVATNFGSLSAAFNSSSFVSRSNPIYNIKYLSISTIGQYMIGGCNNATPYIYISANYGVNWTSKSFTDSNNIGGVQISGAGNYMLVSNSATNTRNIYFSSDSGNNWVNINANASINFLSTTGCNIGLSSNGIYALAMSNNGIFNCLPYTSIDITYLLQYKI